MTTWHLHPTFARLTDGSHVRVLLAFNGATLRLIGASPADTTAELETVIEQAIARDGLPNEVRQLTNPVFADLEADVTRQLSTRGSVTRSSTRGLRPEVVDATNGDDIVWVIEAARDLSDAVERSQPATAGDLIAALHAQVDTAPSGRVR